MEATIEKKVDEEVIISKEGEEIEASLSDFEDDTPSEESEDEADTQSYGDFELCEDEKLSAIMKERDSVLKKISVVTSEAEQKKMDFEETLLLKEVAHKDLVDYLKKEVEVVCERVQKEQEKVRKLDKEALTWMRRAIKAEDALIIAEKVSTEHQAKIKELETIIDEGMKQQQIIEELQKQLEQAKEEAATKNAESQPVVAPEPKKVEKKSVVAMLKPKERIHGEAVYQFDLDEEREKMDATSAHQLANKMKLITDQKRYLGPVVAMLLEHEFNGLNIGMSRLADKTKWEIDTYLNAALKLAVKPITEEEKNIMVSDMNALTRKAFKRAESIIWNYEPVHYEANGNVRTLRIQNLQHYTQRALKNHLDFHKKIALAKAEKQKKNPTIIHRVRALF